MNRLEEIYNEFECNKKSEILKAMKEYAEECVKASLEKASERVIVIDDLIEDDEYQEIKIIKSITDSKNIVLL